MTTPRPDTTAFHAMLELLQDAERNFLQHRNQRDDVDIADNYHHLLDVMDMAMDFYLYNDWERPRLVPVVTPQRKFGGDNAHALYHFAPLRSDKSYRLYGNRAASAYIGFTVYGGEDESLLNVDANYNSDTIRFDADGNFEIVLSAQADDQRAANHIRLAPRSNTLCIRQYFLDQDKSGAAELHIQALDHAGKPPLLSGERMATKLRSMTNAMRGWYNLAPLAWPEDEAAYNAVCPPFKTGESTGHWSTPDNLHAFGFFKLHNNEALVLHGNSPECLYWSCHLWNSCMQTFDYENYQCALSKEQVQLEEDGSWKLVIAHRDPGLPNWLDSTGYQKGFIYFRWLNASALPSAIDCKVISLD